MQFAKGIGQIIVLDEPMAGYRAFESNKFYQTFPTKSVTRLHSSRMRTARVLTVSPSMLCAGGGVCSRGWGVYLLQGSVPGPGGGVPGVGGYLIWGVYLVPGGCLLQGVSALGGVCSQEGLLLGGSALGGEYLVWGVSGTPPL